MDVGQAVFLALVQGLTEFLPISSSAHLILAPLLFGWSDQGLAFDVAVHVGTLAAVVGYFRKELAGISCDLYCSISAGHPVGDSRLGWGILLGTLPVVLAGGLLVHFGTDFLRDPMIIAGATLVFALALWWADAVGARARDEHHLRWSDILFIGLAQMFALIPGASRSGVTLAAGLALGLTRNAAARFSFLLAIPTILLAGAHTTWSLLDGQVPIAWGMMFLATFVSAITAYLCIHFFLRLLDRIGFLPFILYRLVLGVFLLIAFGF